MADDGMALSETMRKAIIDGDADFLREAVKVVAEAVKEAEVTELTGVPRRVPDPRDRSTHRNGYRERRWDTPAGTVGLAIPRVREGSYFPSLLEPRRRAEDLVEALGISSLSKSGVSRICAALKATFIRSVVDQPDETNARAQLRRAVDGPAPRITNVAELLIRFVGMVLAEQDDEWQDGRSYFRPESMALIDAEPRQEEVAPALLMAS